MSQCEVHVVPQALVPPPIVQIVDNDRTVIQNLPAPNFTTQSSDVMPPVVAASRGLAQMFGLDPRAAVLTVLIDLMVFGTDTFSLETLLPLGVLIAGVLGFIVYKMQRKWYGDDHDSALIKCLVVSILTAIPIPISPFLAIPAGIVGALKAIRRK
ncbi:MAG TPA: hypothetical protein VGG19_14170 [Tepidisphaeraceae bacterium]|jgi:hypothetical protein